MTFPIGILKAILEGKPNFSLLIKAPRETSVWTISIDTQLKDRMTLDEPTM